MATAGSCPASEYRCQRGQWHLAAVEGCYSQYKNALRSCVRGKGAGGAAATYTCDTQVLDGGDAMSCSRGEEIAINSALCLLALVFGDMANWDRSTSVVSALFKRTSKIKLTLLQGVEP